MAHIALFPIPDCVAFPSTVYPLHVFEPRYRKMIEHCIASAMPIGICHTQKILKAAELEQSLEQRLQSNQATYKPVTVFSAGPCELLQTLEDGRLLVNIHLNARYQLGEIVQTLPFNIAECDVLNDKVMSPSEQAQAELSKDKILQRLLAMTHDMPEANSVLNSEVWQNKTATQLSFELFQFLQFDTEFMQMLLEMTDVPERLSTILKLLNNQWSDDDQ